MSKTANLLRVARAFIEDPAHWTQGSYARNAEEKPTAIMSPSACKFCSLGALNRAWHSDIEFRTYHEMGAAVALNMAIAGHGTVANYNDTRTHAEVLKMFDEGIVYAESEYAND